MLVRRWDCLTCSLLFEVVGSCACPSPRQIWRQTEEELARGTWRAKPLGVSAGCPGSVPSSQTEQLDYGSRASFLSSFPFTVALGIAQFTLVCMKQQTFRFVQKAG